MDAGPMAPAPSGTTPASIGPPYQVCLGVTLDQDPGLWRLEPHVSGEKKTRIKLTQTPVLLQMFSQASHSHCNRLLHPTGHLAAASVQLRTDRCCVSGLRTMLLQSVLLSVQR